MWCKLTSGTEADFLWQGGFRLELMDAQERPLADLTPVTADSKFLADDTTWEFPLLFSFIYYLFNNRPTRHVIDLLWTCMYSLAYPRCSPCRAQSFKISLPKDLECKGCTVRLIREAREWGKSYKFWSCADVDIVPRKSAVFALLIGISGFIFGA